MKIKTGTIILSMLLMLVVSCNSKFDDTPFDATSTLRYADKMRIIYEKYLTNNEKVYYTVVPSKDFSLYNYNSMINTLNNMIDFANYINIKDTLSTEDYYDDDIHWKQENLHAVIDKIGAAMNFEIDFNGFTQNTHDSLLYMTNDSTESAIVENIQHPDIKTVYDISKIGYDIFLSGVSPLRTITNPLNDSNRKLILFGDSFMHSFAPLLIEEYNYIIMIDSRFIMTDIINEYVDFTDAEILFMHSDLIINNSLLLK